MVEDLKKHKLFFAAITLALFLSFAFNFFGAVTTDSFILNFKDSEALVTNQIVCKGEVFNDQMVAQKGDYGSSGLISRCESKELVPYSSQFGLQGKLYTAGFNLLSNFVHISAVTYVTIVQLATAMGSAVVFGLLALWVRSRFGLIPASVFGLLVAMSPMVVGFSRNLYWTLPLLVLPLVFALYYYRLKSTKKRMLLFWLILGILLYLRYLCGYEYITTLTIMIVAAISYYLYIGGSKTKVYIQQSIIVGVVSFLAFGAALVTHVGALNAYTGSTGKSVSIITQRAADRTSNADQYLKYPYENLKGLASDYYKVTDTYVHYDKQMESNSKPLATLVALSNYMLLPVIHLPISFAASFSLYAQSMGMFVVLLALLYVMRKKWIPKRLSTQIRALYLAFAIGLLGYFSWLMLGYSHSLVHAHINGILMYLPFALFGYVIIGIFIESVIGKFTRTYKK